MKIENNGFNSLNCLSFKLLNRKSMFAAPHSNINSLKSGLFLLTGKSIFKRAEIELFQYLYS